MSWDEEVREAKEELGYNPYEYVSDFKEVTNLAKENMSSEAKENHQIYLQSPEWKLKRDKILERDNHSCQDCLLETQNITKLFNDIIKKFKIKKLNYFVKASEVHHIDYSYLQTEFEEEYCISLCNICHRLRHVGNITMSLKSLRETRRKKIYFGIYSLLLKQPEIIKESNKQHDNFIKSLITNPKIFLNKRGENGDKKRS